MFKYAAASVAAICLPMMASAVSIDTFDDDQAMLLVSGLASDSSTITGISALGGTRTITVENTGLGANGFTTAQVVDSQFRFSNGAGSTGIASVSYSTGGIDLTDGGSSNAVRIAVLEIDLGVDITLDIDGSSVTKTSVTVGNIDFMLSDFTSDVTNADKITLVLDSGSTVGVDAIVDWVGSVDSTVPLPAGGVLLLSGLAGLAAMRRKS